MAGPPKRGLLGNYIACQKQGLCVQFFNSETIAFGIFPTSCSQSKWCCANRVPWNVQFISPNYWNQASAKNSFLFSMEFVFWFFLFLFFFQCPNTWLCLQPTDHVIYDQAALAHDKSACLQILCISYISILEYWTSQIQSLANQLYTVIYMYDSIILHSWKFNKEQHFSLTKRMGDLQWLSGDIIFLYNFYYEKDLKIVIWSLACERF